MTLRLVALAGCLLGLLLGAWLARLRPVPGENAPRALPGKPAPASTAPVARGSSLDQEIASVRADLAAMPDPADLLAERLRPAREAARALGALLSDEQRDERQLLKENNSLLDWLDSLLIAAGVTRDEVAFHPDRDRLLADYLEGAGCPISPEQRPAWDRWIASREGAWEEYLGRRRGLLALERALHLSRSDTGAIAGRDAILSESQRAALGNERFVASCDCEQVPLAIGPPRLPCERMPSIFERKETWIADLADLARHNLELWVMDSTDGRHLSNAAFEEYCREYFKLPGVATEHVVFTDPPGFRAAQLELQVRLQRAILDDDTLTPSEKRRVRAWSTTFDAGW